MNAALKWKLIAGFMLVFVAGGMTGGFIGASHARHMFVGMHQKMLAERMRHRLRAELQLTNEQEGKIGPIIDQTAARLHEIRRSTGRQVHEALLDAHRQMAPMLTEEQRSKLQRLETQRHRWLFHGGRRGPSASPESSTPPSGP